MQPPALSPDRNPAGQNVCRPRQQIPVLAEALNGFSKSGTGVVGGGVIGASEGAVGAAEGDVGDGVSVGDDVDWLVGARVGELV